MTAQAKAILLVGLGLAIGSLGYLEYKHIQADALLAEHLAVADSTAHAQREVADNARRVASVAESLAEAAKGRAMAQVAAGKALAARNDSLTRRASAERDSAELVLRDSASTNAQLREHLRVLLVVDRADSVAAAQQEAQDGATIHGLLATISADSLALARSKAEAQALRALSETLGREIALMRKDRPGVVGTWGPRFVGAAVGYFVGRNAR